jgi:hypothetical protein
MRLAALLVSLWLSGCCAGPGPRRLIGPPVRDAGRDAPFALPFDAPARRDAPPDTGSDAPDVPEPVEDDAGMPWEDEDAPDPVDASDAAEPAPAEDPG